MSRSSPHDLLSDPAGAGSHPVLEPESVRSAGFTDGDVADPPLGRPAAGADPRLDVHADRLVSASLPVRGCGCPACAARRDPAAGTSGVTAVAAPVAAPVAAVSLQSLSDYLTHGFWQAWGELPFHFNVTSTGIGAKSGTITYNISGWADDPDGLSPARKALATEVFKLYSAVLGINFTEVSGAGGDIRFTDNDSGAYAYLVSGWLAGGDEPYVIADYSVVNVESSWFFGISSFDSYLLHTIFHEVGHAIGLGHQGLYNYTGAPLSYSTSAQFANDSWQASMMSYWAQTENYTTGASFAWLHTPMAVDWIALNDLYGSQVDAGKSFGVANAFLGDTIYGVGTNISAAVSRIWNEFSFYAGRDAYTIVDGGGYDTLNVSHFSASQLINLAPSQSHATAPSVSSIGGKIGNLSIAVGTIIEAAVGGNGNDRFLGNDADNTFRGGGGNDRFDDSSGSDIYYGETGVDTLCFADSLDVFDVSLSGGFLCFKRRSGSADVDRAAYSIENVSFNNAVYSSQQLVAMYGLPSLPVVTIQSANASLTSGATTNSTVLTFRGSLGQPLAPNQVIAIYRNDVQIGTVTPSAVGSTSWSFTTSEAPGTRTLSFQAQVVALDGSALGLFSSSFELTLDTEAPLVSLDSLQTDDTTPLIRGTVSEPGAAVTVTIAGVTRAALNQGNGQWQLQWDDPLNPGRPVEVVVTATDAAGNSLSAISSSMLQILAPPEPFYFSVARNITVPSPYVLGGLKARSNDIISFDGQTFQIWLQGDASGLAGAVLADFAIISHDEVVVAFKSAVTLSGLHFETTDLARLTRSGSGFVISPFFDGSDVGLTTSGEAIDALTGLADGSLLISTRRKGDVPVSGGQLSFGPEDLLQFTFSSVGDTTAGQWSLYADGSDVGLKTTSKNRNENIVAVDATADGRLVMASQGRVRVAGLNAMQGDAFVFQPATLGSTTSGAFLSAPVFNGSLYGLDANAVTGLEWPV